MTTSTWQRWGFEPTRLAFTLRTAVAAGIALVLAWLAGLEHPQWAAMTVWAASLPVRGQLLEKSWFRVQGTVLGAVFGTGLLFVAAGQPWVLVIGLSLWIGACTWAGYLIRGLASYGAMLAGYSAAMVALLHSQQSSDPFAVGVDRLLTVLLGVLVAVAWGWCFAGRSDYRAAARQTHQQGAQVLEMLADVLAGGAHPARQAEQLLVDMAAAEQTFDGMGAGSLKARAAVRALRRQLAAQVSLLLWMQRTVPAAEPDRLAQSLRAAAAAMRAGGDLPGAGQALQAAATLAPGQLMREALAGMARALARYADAEQRVLASLPVTRARRADLAEKSLHRDWQGGREAALRAALAIFLAGAAWQLSGWQAGAFMLLGAAVMTTVFSTMDNPVRLLKLVVVGQTLGVLGAMICRWLVWPHMPSEAAVVLSMLPFMLAGGLFMGHRRGAGPLGFDFSMVFLLLLQPVWPLPAEGLATAWQAPVAVILGPLLALLAFALVYPVDGRRRLRALRAAMVAEIQTMAARTGVASRRSGWRTRLSHRLLAMVRWADKAGESPALVMQEGSAFMLLGAVILHLDDCLHGPTPLPPVAARRIAAILLRLQQLEARPARAAQALTRAAVSLAAQAPVDVVLLRDAASALQRTRLLQQASA